MQTMSSLLPLDGTHPVTAAHPRSILLEFLRTVPCAVRDAILGYVRRRIAKRTREALASLDDRMLRDLGLTREEIGSISAEIAGQAERTRLRALQMPLV